MQVLVIKIIHTGIGRLKKEIKNLLFNMIFGAFNLVAVSLFYKDIPLTVVILSLLTISFFVYYKSPVFVPIFVFCMIFGTLAEIFSVYNGAWSYALPNFFNVPLWLFILWGNSGLFIYKMAIGFERLGFHR